jgi:hypothetical protein
VYACLFHSLILEACSMLSIANRLTNPLTLEKLVVAKQTKKFPLIKPECVLSVSTEPAHGPCTGKVEYDPLIQILDLWCQL